VQALETRVRLPFAFCSRFGTTFVEHGKGAGVVLYHRVGEVFSPIITGNLFFSPFPFPALCVFAALRVDAGCDVLVGV
jgi:hypothetical protein